MSDNAPALFNPPSLSATELHEILLTAHAAGKALRRRFIDCLRALEESKLYMQLGFPSLAAYAEAVSLVELDRPISARLSAFPTHCVELSRRRRSRRNGDLATRQRGQCCVA